MSSNTKSTWDWEIVPQTTWLGSSASELWSYRHLVAGLVRRDFLLSYQQTVLGPLWMLFQPVMTLVTYVLVFGKLVGISTDGIPPTLFYLTGIVLWNLFNESFLNTSSIFRDNIHIFSKVYFPRMVVPLAQMMSQLIRFFIQLFLLLLITTYYILFTSWQAPGLLQLIIIPLIVVLVACLSLGLGMIVSVLTGKYRDLSYIIGLGIRLLMFLTPVVYPINYVDVKWRWIVQLNPLTSLFELFRLLVLGKGLVTPGQLLYSVAFISIVFVAGLLVFNKQGDKLVDVI
ncbi:ABC transporter permease [Hymenobacter taeanensis]|uniref:Transport permease protein n=1 Tax=Hymenobacter taeanensis TaxID=2735321 RepID=A0A6M6BM49_9BACT|nr:MULTISPECIES: ABC transporter permease [Hymenobacter]QJX49059.1 ABC transporter permease [Hymenobacter taeanensis]UOQ81420.1 ABC transporter permease [Hymenobacter sp. 5414T-23]